MGGNNIMDNGYQNRNVTGDIARIELSLRDSELSYRRLFEAAKDGILIPELLT
jgi:hypothetical protein